MAKKLVIVESPAKAKTIEKFLGRDFEVRASMGHIIDLPKKGLGVNTRKDFAPQYEIIEKKDRLIDELKAASSRADEVYLAPDPDREGEFIAWSLKNILGLQNPHRAVFHEITKSAVQEAIKKPRQIDENLFNAQQARRVLDRLVGYKISPLLWRRIQSGTSAGRVQSVALRLICDREAEVRAFVPEEYWSITAILSKQGQKERFEATLISRLKDIAALEAQESEGQSGTSPEEGSNTQQPGTTSNGKTPKTEKGRIKISSKEEADTILADLRNATYSVLKYEEREQRRQPYLPYTTSTMQQDASVRLYFKPKKTMSLAQHLYEGIELGTRGHQGLITYMRTDSTRISEEAQVKVKSYIGSEFGQPYVGSGRTGKAKATTQDAHEAIRPTDVSLTPQSVKQFLTADQFKLYNLIWRRFVASFMTPAIFDTVRADIVAKQYVFRATGSNLKFPGFYAVWPREEEERVLPVMQLHEPLDLRELKPAQHFTQPPPRFTEASLIKELEEQGIGRPSTYVPIISTIQDRGYVDQDQRRFIPTWLGETINEVMNKHFPDIVDTSFTADMERKLDDVEEGRRSWIEFLRTFYTDFKTTMTKAEAEMDKVQKQVEMLDEQCPDCGRPLAIYMGRFGRFISCSGFPECRYRRSFVNKTGALCPSCGGDLVERKTRQKKRVFYGCSNYPNCNFAMWEKPVADLCPNCGGIMVIPKPGQEPVCYNEVILVQRNNEAQPNAEKKTTRSKAAVSTENEAASPAATTATTTKRRATTTTGTRATKAATTRKTSTAKAASTRTSKTSSTTRATRATTTRKTTKPVESVEAASSTAPATTEKPARRAATTKRASATTPETKPSKNSSSKSASSDSSGETTTPTPARRTRAIK